MKTDQVQNLKEMTHLIVIVPKLFHGLGLNNTKQSDLLWRDNLNKHLLLLLLSMTVSQVKLPCVSLFDGF
jgi:hypothetical protein